MATRNATRRVIESAFSNYVIREWSGLQLSDDGAVAAAADFDLVRMYAESDF